MKSIQIFHWCGTFKELNGTYLEHKRRYKYTDDLRKWATEALYQRGYNVMLYRTGDVLVIGVDNKKFQQG